MSQYLKIKFNFLNCILFNVLIRLSFCDNQSLFFIQNDSLIFDNYFQTETSANNENINLALNSTPNLNHTNQKNYYLSNSNSVKCTDTKKCPNNNKCCPININSSNNIVKICIEITSQSGDKCQGSFNDVCNSTYKCETVFGLKCKFVEQLPNKHCICEEDNYFDYSQAKCVTNYSGDYNQNTAMEIYKITMIFASCCLALILIIFLACILRKSYCPPRSRMVPLDNSTIPDIFTLFPHVGNYDGGPLGDGTLPPFEKPPTYDETLTLIRNEIGIPPPVYRSGNNSSNSSNSSTPEMSSRIVISRPTLVTVSDETNSSNLVSSGTDSSSEVSIAGPSGYGRPGYLGIDNLAFVNT